VDALGFELGDPLIGLAITVIILTWDSWQGRATTAGSLFKNSLDKLRRDGKRSG
jgi:hypothetical protein